MGNARKTLLMKGRLWQFFILALLLVIMPCSSAQSFTLNVIDASGNPVTGYRWTLEEDATFYVDPDLPPDPDPLTINFHKSYMPLVATGDSSTLASLDAVDPAKRYFISVLPYAGYSMSGAAVAAGQTNVNVTVHALPVPTAQISVYVFEDISPLNNMPDFPQEHGLEGFTIILEEAGGRYGQSGGQVMNDAFGNPLGEVMTDARGFATIKNLWPAKYGIRVTAPAGQDWHQTTTIEGSPVIDAWVKSNEPTTLVEFGIPSTHVFMGFTQSIYDSSVLTGGSTITGQVVNLHMNRPPNVADTGIGRPFINAWVGLNDPSGNCVYAQPCDPDTGEFSIPNVPAGSYEIVVWDEFLDIIIAFRIVNVPGDGSGVDLGQFAVNDWFSHMWFWTFNDTDENGMWDAGELPMSDQNINIRWRDGTIYQAFPTDMEGFMPFDEVFPFFNWLVAEVDFLRYKATGATIVVDAGGVIDPAEPWSLEGTLNPQLQPENGDMPYRVETGPVLLEAFQAFAGLTNAIMFGKTAYGPGENGGISGIIYYTVTRAEENPAYAVAETWEPGIPRVQVNLYQDANQDLEIDDINGGGVQLADVDNYPFGWADGGAMGPEDVERSGSDGVFDLGDAIRFATSDSWDDNLPTDCPGGDPSDPLYLGGRCYDGVRNWNQVRPGVFDGGYAFGPQLEDGSYLPSGMYIVEAVPPRGYEIIKEEDKNVDLGDTYTASPLALPPPCVGDDHLVLPYLSLQSDDAGNPLPGIDPADLIEAPFANTWRPLCNLKQISLTAGRNAAVDFFMMTKTPIAAHYTGITTNDLGNEFSPISPNFIEKFGAPFIPVAFYDWTGHEISRVYTDQWGKYNGLLPSTYTVNIPCPSGVSPSMLTVCLNAAIMQDPDTGLYVMDPHFRRELTQSCYTFQYMPGATTYLDTPVLPISAWASRSTYPLDCDFPSGTPVIASVMGPQGGAYVPSTNQQIVIESLGMTEVPNPQFDPELGNPSTVWRDYGFGSVTGKVKIGGTDLRNIQWLADGSRITATVPNGTTTGQLEITRGDNNKKTVIGVTVTVGPTTGTVRHVIPSVTGFPATPIQNAIDAANPGDLILVHPGLYDELVLMWKPVRLQGSGLGTIINAFKMPVEKLQLWRDRVSLRVANGDVDLLPGQDPQFGPFPNIGLFPTEQGPGVLVMAEQGSFTAARSPRIDGFLITGADNGGGVLVNGYCNYLQISNNRIIANQGVGTGGIRVGHPVTPFAFAGQPVDAQNDFVTIRYNDVRQNGATGEGVAAGGGIGLFTGSDYYQVADNHVCGNFSIGSGAGIAHQGLSRGTLIARNKIAFNQSFHQTINESSGGGIAIEGIQPAAGGLGQGSGTVTIDANLILGNYAGSGDGGAIRLLRVNGQDVLNAPGTPTAWYRINIFNNMIVNNVTGLAGAVSLQDVAYAYIVHNVISNNDSVGTAGAAFTVPGAGMSTPQTAGIVSHAHSADLAAAFAAGVAQEYSNPRLVDNIIWHNRSFYFTVEANDGFGGLLPDVAVDPPVYDDLVVLGTALPQSLNPRYCILTDPTGYDTSNASVDPEFVREYVNGDGAYLIVQDRMTVADAAAAVDEGGNFVDVSFGPLSLYDPDTGLTFGDYHIQGISPAINMGTSTINGAIPDALKRDYDGQKRPRASIPDVGADEFYP